MQMRMQIKWIQTHFLSFRSWWKCLNSDCFSKSHYLIEFGCLHQHIWLSWSMNKNTTHVSMARESEHRKAFVWWWFAENQAQTKEEEEKTFFSLRLFAWALRHFPGLITRTHSLYFHTYLKKMTSAATAASFVLCEMKTLSLNSKASSVHTAAEEQYEK